MVYQEFLWSTWLTATHFIESCRAPQKVRRCWTSAGSVMWPGWWLSRASTTPRVTPSPVLTLSRWNTLSRPRKLVWKAKFKRWKIQQLWLYKKTHIYWKRYIREVSIYKFLFGIKYSGAPSFVLIGGPQNHCKTQIHETMCISLR